MRVRLTADWVWREVFDYYFDAPLPDDWDTMTNQGKMDWLEQFDCSKDDSWPVDLVNVLSVEEIYQAMSDPCDRLWAYNKKGK